MSADQVVDFVVTGALDVLYYSFAAVVFARVDEHCFVVGKLDKYRVTLPHVKKVSDELAAVVRLVSEPRFKIRKLAGAQHCRSQQTDQRRFKRGFYFLFFGRIFHIIQPIHN